MRGIVLGTSLAAIAGGFLRMADSFTANWLTAHTLALLYLVTDIFLLIGIAGLWAMRRAALGIAGHIGIAAFAIGILIIRASAFDVGAYQLGASVALFGLALYSLEVLIKRNAAILAPLAWLVSLAAGIALTAGLAPIAMVTLAGVAFGAGFVAAGVEMLRN